MSIQPEFMAKLVASVEVYKVQVNDFVADYGEGFVSLIIL